MSKSTKSAATKPAATSTVVANVATMPAPLVAQVLAMAHSKGILKDLPATATGKAVSAALQGNVQLQQDFVRAVKGGQGPSTIAALAALFGTGTAKAKAVPTATVAGQGRKFPNDWVLLSINCAGNPKSGASRVRFALYQQLGVGATLGALKAAGMRAADFAWDTHASRNLVTVGPASALQSKPKTGTKRASNGVTLASTAAPAPAPAE